MACDNKHIKGCTCPKVDCSRHAKCCDCVAYHRDEKKNLPVCLRNI
ncbi:MAG: hypothetical protein WC248_03230 [Candidatus Methanomethylophilaceae archaeon]